MSFKEKILIVFLFLCVFLVINIVWNRWFIKTQVGRFINKHIFEKYLYLEYPCCGVKMDLLFSVFCGTPSKSATNDYYCIVCKRKYKANVLFCIAKVIALIFCMGLATKLFEYMGISFLPKQGNKIILIFVFWFIATIFLFVLFCFIIHRLRWYSDKWNDEV